MTTPSGRHYQLSYDPYGRPSLIVDESDNETQVAYNSHSQVVSVQTSQQNTQFAYDDAGRFEHWFTSNQVGPVLAHLNNSLQVNEALQNPWSITWSPNGISSATDPSGVTSNFKLSHFGDIEQVLTDAISTHASYDRLGNLLATTDALGVETKVQLSPGRRVEQLSIGSSLGRSFNYNDAGQISAVSALGDQQPLVAFDYDETNQTQTVQTPTSSTTYTKNGLGLTTKVVDQRGATSLYERDADGFVTKHEGPGFSVAYHRSTCSGMSSITDSALGSVDLPTTPQRELDTTGRITIDETGRTFRYDSAGRLKETISPNGSRWEYEYNNLGLLQQDRSDEHGTRNFTYDATGAVITVNQNGQPLYNCSYDEAGRRVSERHANGTIRNYVWDALDHLTEIIETNATETARTKITYAGISRPDTINGIQIGWDDGITNKPTQIGDTRYLRYGTKTLACTEGSTWTNDTGNDPYGIDDGDGLRFGFRGELALDDLVFMGSRIYQPATRSFLTRDPLPPVAGKNCFTSAYHYCYNDPINNIDPTGQRPLTIQEFEHHIERANQSPFNGLLAYADPLQPIRPYLGDDQPWSSWGDVWDVGVDGAKDFWNKEWAYDWGTGGAAVFNIGYGAYKINSGLGWLALVPPATALSPALGIATALFGGYHVVTGGARVIRGGRQAYEVAQNPRCESECTTGDNVERLVRGVIPGPVNSGIDFVGGLI